jgi:acyl-CoA reductase-like NAD-dependent aldehyde dehydrogenase
MTVRTVPLADPGQVPQAVDRAIAAGHSWERTPVEARAAILHAAADRMEDALPRLCALLVKEGSKCWGDAVAEVREAVDFLRYYANEAERILQPVTLPGPTGESNVLRLTGRGAWVCISPWNFPLAIFTGQVAAALVTGNTVLAKPAEQTPAVAAEAVRLLHAAGVPADALQLLHGAGETVGAALVAEPRIAGVVFTGSTQVAKIIQRALAAKDGPIVPLIAETGGINAMLVDSTALPEQVADAVVQSAFRSAGQRCSALRLLLVHEAIADGVIRMIQGAAQELVTGDPAKWRTDVGPVIDGEAFEGLQRHVPPPAGGSEAVAAGGRLRSEATADPAAGLRGGERRTGPAGGVRARAAHRALERRSAGRDPGDQPRGLRPHAGTADAHRQPRAGAGPRGADRQRVRQPQHDRRGGGRAAIRRRGDVRNRAQGRRPELPGAFLCRTDGDDQHHRRRRQRRPAGLINPSAGCARRAP